MVCDGEKAEKKDGGDWLVGSLQPQQLDLHHQDGEMGGQDQDQYHPVDDHGQHPSRSFRPGCFFSLHFALSAIKVKMLKVFQIMFSHFPSNEFFFQLGDYLTLFYLYL